MTKEGQFLPYEQALVLKELGFEAPCFGCYENIEIRDYKKGLEINEAFVLNTINGYVKYDGSGQTPAPIYPHAFLFFERKYSLYCITTKNYERFRIIIQKITLGNKPFSQNRLIFFDDNFDNKFTCEEEVNLEAIKKIIQIVKNKNYFKYFL